jgi:hypothetical protein
MRKETSKLPELLNYDLPLTKESGAYVCGDGSGSVKIDTTTGDINLISAAE